MTQSYPTSHKRWKALERKKPHPVQPCDSDSGSDKDYVAEESSDIDQSSHEVVIIRDSCDITVETDETQVAASLQAALQVAIAVVVNITIADSKRAEVVTEELMQQANIRQAHRQKLVIVNSRSIDVSTSSTDIAISLQLLLQILLSLMVQLDIL